MGNTAPEQFGDVLRRFRRRTGLTQEELAECAALSTYSISNLERGVASRPHRDTVERLANALELQGDERAAFVTYARTAGRDPTTASIDTSVTTNSTFASISCEQAPVPITPLIGREGDAGVVTSLLLRTEVRWVTLTGLGGVGKTHLALDLVHRSAIQGFFADSIAYVALASLRDPKNVLPAVARAVGLREVRADSHVRMLATYLQDRHLLLMLDNMEHLATAAPQVAELLGLCPQLAVLATSRVPLHLRGEHVYHMAPLALPDHDEQRVEVLEQSAAVALFVQRARQANAAFSLASANAATVATICHVLDGLPLAIELAAARSAVMSPALLLDHLGAPLSVLTGGPQDAPSRHRSLREMLAWSYDLLDPAYQFTFRALSVFAGGSTLDAMTAVCRNNAGSNTDPLDPFDPLDTVSVLLEHSLIERAVDVQQHDSTVLRVTMLETVREYAWERLQESGDAPTVRQAHAHYFLEFAEAADARLRAGDQTSVLNCMETEYGNLRVALRWSLDHQEVSCGLRLATALCRFWYARGYASEGRAWLQKLLACAPGDGVAPDDRVRAAALDGAALLALRQGDYAEATARYEAALELQRGLGDVHGLARILNQLGIVAQEQGDFERAERLHAESLALHRSLGNVSGMAATLNNLGRAAGFRGDYVSATTYFEDSLALRRQINDLRGVALCLSNLGDIAREQGQYERATTLGEESLLLRRQLGDRWGEALALSNLAEAAREQGAVERALELCTEGLQLFRNAGDRWDLAVALCTLGCIAWNCDNLEEAETHFRESLAIRRDLGDHRGYAWSAVWLGALRDAQGRYEESDTLLGEAAFWFRQVRDKKGVAVVLERMASIRAAQGHTQVAIQCCAAASAIRDALGAPLPPVDTAAHRQLVARLQHAAGATLFQREWEAGLTVHSDILLDSLGIGKGTRKEVGD